jgi:hypothetical protein
VRASVVFSDQNGWVYALDAHGRPWKLEEHEPAVDGLHRVQDGVAFVPAASWGNAIDSPAYLHVPGHIQPSNRERIGRVENLHGGRRKRRTT